MSLEKILFILFAFLLFSCSDKKEKELTERENALLKREQQFADKETEYESLLKMRDSLTEVKEVKDTISEIKNWPENLTTNWNSKMVCKESNCSNYVIGDQRSETWKFISDSTGIYTNVLNNNKLIRVFKAQYSPEKIMLDFAKDSTAKSKTKINVVLNDIKQNVIKGTQTITGQDNCRAVFSVELTPVPKK